MASIFTKIIQGEIPCHKIAESEDYFAFLDVFPLRKGHTLVIPKKEIDYIFDLDDELLSGLMTFSKKIAKAVEAAIPCKRIAVAVAGLEVPHAHIHLVPMNTIGDLSFQQEKLKLSQEKLGTIAESIRQHLK